MRWLIARTGLEEAPEPIEEVLEFHHSKFHKAQEWGPMVRVILTNAPDDEPLWIFADEIILEDDDLDPPHPDEYWHPADMGDRPSCVWA